MKFYLDVQVDGSGQTTIDRLAKTLRGIIPTTANIEMIDNKGGVPEKIIRITYEAAPSAMDELFNKIKNIPGAWLPDEPHQAHSVL